MRSMYSSPLRVYLGLAVLTLIGIYSGFGLPISLFPNSSKPSVGVSIPYKSLTPEEFLSNYGRELEGKLRNISVGNSKVETVSATYQSFSLRLKVDFQWGVDPKEAMKEVQLTANAFTSRMPKEIRDEVQFFTYNRSGGFLALSFYSEKRSLSELYDLLEPVLSPKFSQVSDADNVSIYNPEEREISLELIPESLATYKLFPRHIEEAVRKALTSQNGGSLVLGPKNLVIQMPRQVNDLDSLASISIPTPSGARVHLSEVAKIDVRTSESDSQSFKTSGVPSLILFAQPKPGGNVKRMSEELIAASELAMKSLPDDIQMRKLVDPSEFIRSAIWNVSREVALGAFLAVLILYLFIGSIKNVATAAIEIPLSMVLAFILMKWSGMNLNIISLGGLALSAGMNVDASVVVMENIFRHLDRVHGKLSPQERLTLIVTAVKEVRFPIIASTIASLVVFVPLAFTSDLSNAVLGDLAKTVVFSHGLSAFVALILVPTVRLQLLSYSGFMHTKPPIERQILWLEKSYSRALGSFMARPRLQLFTYVALTASLIALLTTVLPKLPREIIGLPDTDWIVFGIDTEGNNSIAQMESFVEEEEAELLNKFGDKIQYTFTQLRDPNSVTILARLKDKSQMTEVWKAMEKAFPNTSFTNYYVTSWNPAEMPIPNPPHLRVVIRGGKINDRAETATAIRDLLQDKQVFPRFQSTPATGYEENIVFIPNREQWSLLEADRASFSIFDIADLARVATNGRNIGELYLNEVRTPIHLGYPKNRVKTPEDLGSLPIAIGESLVPLRALGSIELKEVPPLYYREDGKDLYVITGQHNKGDERKIKPSQKEAERLIEEWKSSEARRGIKMEQAPTVLIEDAAKDMNEAIHQLSIAMLLSILLIFLTMVIQFGSIANAALVLVSVPLAIIGVLLSLFIFNSTLSLNSVLGIILVNGLAVANSIILVDFLKRLVESGKSPREAALEAAESRLRPILITSLTTLLGMLPIALGHGEGGRILQPLGIAVSGGLWVSMGLTLFVVPALQVAYLELRQKRAQLANAPRFLEPSLAAAGKEGFFSRGLASSDESEISKNKSSATKRKTQNLPFEGPTDTLQ